jgi:ribosomal protein S18 acetylase RimI-like enzyme
VPDAVTSRPALADDRPFLVELYAANRAAELAGVGWSPATVRVFLEQQNRAREASWAATTPHHDDEVLLRGERPVGRLVLDRRVDGIAVVDIALVPTEQGRGTGTAVLAAVLEEADAAGVPVRLHVVSDNPARRLYEGLGFRAVDTDGVHVSMERLPAAGAGRGSGAQPSTAT